jgi:hypothetical protein
MTTYLLGDKKLWHRRDFQSIFHYKIMSLTLYGGLDLLQGFPGEDVLATTGALMK